MNCLVEGNSVGRSRQIKELRILIQIIDFLNGLPPGDSVGNSWGESRAPGDSRAIQWQLIPLGHSAGESRSLFCLLDCLTLESPTELPVVDSLSQGGLNHIRSPRAIINQERRSPPILVARCAREVALPTLYKFPPRA